MTGALPDRNAPAGASHVAQRAPAQVPRRLRGILCLDDFEALARRHLPRPLFGYVAGTTERGDAHAANAAALRRLSLVPRVLVDVSGRQQGRRLFGVDYRHPIGIAPMGLSAVIAMDGDVALAAAAEAAGLPFVLSASSLTPLERVARAGARWYQAYLPGDPARIGALVDRVEAAGYQVFVLTVDVPVAANRENNIRNGFDIPLRPNLALAWQGLTHPRWLLGTAARTLLRHGMPHFENMDAGRGPPILSRNLVRAVGNRDQLAWTHAELIRRRWKGRFVIKGILDATDARRAADLGADGVILSNHGGRQLDGAIAPLSVLPRIAGRLGSTAVMIDGGFRRGTDVLKALALGADFVFVGRPFLFAAAVAQQAGVSHAIRLLASEIDRDMALLGVDRLSALTPGHLAQVPQGDPVQSAM